jgi:hypothetical protein
MRIDAVEKRSKHTGDGKRRNLDAVGLVQIRKVQEYTFRYAETTFRLRRWERHMYFARKGVGEIV